MQELEFHVSRFTTLATQGSLIAGFAFEGLVHMEVPPEWRNSMAELVFWVSGSLCMMFALYVLIIGSIAGILGHQLALFGSDGKSLEDAVTVLRKRRLPIFGAAALSLASLVASGASMAYIKMGIAGPPTAICFGGFCLWTFFSLTTLVCNLANRELVTGSTHIYTGRWVLIPCALDDYFTPPYLPNKLTLHSFRCRGYFDLATITPGYNGHVPLDETA